MAKRKSWTEEEDGILEDLVKLHGVDNWKLISKELEGKFEIVKSSKQCKERWNNNLDPSLKKRNWTSEEDNALFNLHKQHGNKWSLIAQELVGRSENTIKNHFYSIIRKNLRKYNKGQPTNKKITGNIQDLLLDSEVSKILLKKPRHYHPKKPKKPLSDPANNPSTNQSTVSQEPRIKANINIRRCSTDLFKPLRLSPKSISPQIPFIEVPETPLDPMFLNPNFLYKDLSTPEIVISNVCDQAPSLLHLDLYPKTPESYSNSSCRHSNRAFSFKSSEGSFCSRKSSRNNTNESCFERTESRKNSKTAQILNCITEVKESCRVLCLPPYSPSNSFHFNMSPKNK